MGVRVDSCIPATSRSMNDATEPIAVLILAAGASRRLGRSKALLTSDDGSNLIQRVVATAAVFAPYIYVVIQSEDQSIGQTLGTTVVHWVANPDWKEGMASSIRAGIRQIGSEGIFDGALILLVDQPELNVDILSLMTTQFHAGHRIVACLYDDVIGVPALIGAEFFDQLLELTGDEGARHWLRGRSDGLAVVPFPGGARDVDTAADIGRLRCENNS